MKKTYIKKQEIIEAIKYDGNNRDEIYEFAKTDASLISIEHHWYQKECLDVQTIRGTYLIHPGDYVAKTMLGYIVVFKPEAFHVLYEEEI